MKIAYFPFFGRNWTITNGNLMVRTRAYIPNPTYDPNDPNSIIGTFSHGWADLGPATIAGAGRSPSRSLATSLSRAPVRLASRSLNACHVLGMQEAPLRLPLTQFSSYRRHQVSGVGRRSVVLSLAESRRLSQRLRS